MPGNPLEIQQSLNSGRQVGFAEGRLYGPDGKLYAHATTTCVVLTPGG
jgi:acyl-coenzyme A thioesterase PaaI-like protein